MPTIYFQTTTNLSDSSPYILKDSKKITPALADNLFRKKLYETHKKDIPALIDFHYKRSNEPSEFTDHVIELLEVAIDKSENIRHFKSLSFWGDPVKAERYKRRTFYALEYLKKLSEPEPNEANIIRLLFNGEKVVLADMFRQLTELELPNGQKAFPLSKKDMARFLIGVTESFKDSKLETTYDYFKTSKSKMAKGSIPKKYRIKVTLEEL
jgi:hypothetical protein